MVQISPVLQAALRAAMPEGLLEQAVRVAADALLQAWPEAEPPGWPQDGTPTPSPCTGARSPTGSGRSGPITWTPSGRGTAWALPISGPERQSRPSGSTSRPGPASSRCSAPVTLMRCAAGRSWPAYTRQLGRYGDARVLLRDTVGRLERISPHGDPPITELRGMLADIGDE